MSKPICIIYFPANYDAGPKRTWIYDYMRYLNGEENQDGSIVYGDRKEYWGDYYWFCFYDDTINTPRFEPYYEKDFDEIKFEELKAIITEQINQQK